MSSKLPVRAIAAGLFSAAPKLVFDAFLDTRMIGRFMFGPGIRDEEIVGLTNDPRVGSRVVIDIAPVIDGCELTLTHEMPYGWEDFVEKSKEAWGRMIDKLTEILDDVG